MTEKTADNKDIHIYRGEGVPISGRSIELPEFDLSLAFEDPKNYIASEGLRDAVNVALNLGQPLLVTGEPGTGKTRLAASIAWELGLELLEFHTKTTSTATDLFYQYDALRRFQDAQIKDQTQNQARDQISGQTPIEDYITCQALGIAILLTNPADQARRILPEKYRKDDPSRSVVLIDEIDKAPRDLPNDVLDEIENMQFRIRETTWEPFKANRAFRPVVILTSNSEKNLPDAFLRRCVFYHIEFPGPEMLKQIVVKRFKGNGEKTGFKPEFTGDFLDAAVNHFENIRKLDLKKWPSTAEFLNWISILKTLGANFSQTDDGSLRKIEMSCPVLAKNRDDLMRIKRYFADALK